jgi:BirA family biotin operon repressor/biotin-[acetyl-CoA-carboxylase] ligase
MTDRSGVPPRISYETIGSTNEEALGRARAGERGPLWITARRQDAGRGRRGRSWVSEPGNLYASLLLGDPSAPERAPQLSFVAALAAHDAVSALVPAFAPRAALKWPNDLLLDGSKFAGILVEAEGTGASFAAVIGIGINCRHHPADTAYPVTDLAAAGADVAADALFDALAAATAFRLAQWDRGAGFAAIRADWLARAFGLGGEIGMRAGAHALTGHFESVDESGRLLLRLADGRIQAFAGGEVADVRQSLTTTGS